MVVVAALPDRLMTVMVRMLMVVYVRLGGLVDTSRRNLNIKRKTKKQTKKR